MSDEPLFCPACGKEWGSGPDDCKCDYETPDGRAFVPHQEIPRERRFCHVCGIVPGPGLECHFYQDGGRAKGCEMAPLPA